jgi:hypothetical protein
LSTHSNDTRPSKLVKLQKAAAWIRDTGLGTFGVVLLLVVTAAGWGASTIGLMDFAVKHMAYEGWKRALVPTAFDGAAIGLSIAAFRAAINGRSALFARLGIAGFTALSSWMNWKHIADPIGQPIGALLPVSAVILMESLLAEARRAHEARTKQPRPRIHPLRWVFDRSGTKAILKAHVLGLPLPDQFAAAAAKLQEDEQAAAEATKGRRRRSARPPVVQPETTQPQGPVPSDAVTEVIPVITDESSGRHAQVAEVIELDQERPGWLTTEMTAKEAIWRYLDEHGEGVGGAQLTRLARAWGFDVNGDYGRTVKGQWRKAGEAVEDRPGAVGE